MKFQDPLKVLLRADLIFFFFPGYPKDAFFSIFTKTGLSTNCSMSIYWIKLYPFNVYICLFLQFFWDRYIHLVYFFFFFEFKMHWVVHFYGNGPDSFWLSLIFDRDFESTRHLSCFMQRSVRECCGVETKICTGWWVCEYQSCFSPVVHTLHADLNHLENFLD